jgi:hypothetical protein
MARVAPTQAITADTRSPDPRQLLIGQAPPSRANARSLVTVARSSEIAVGID